MMDGTEPVEEELKKRGRGAWLFRGAFGEFMGHLLDMGKYGRSMANLLGNGRSMRIYENLW